MPLIRILLLALTMVAFGCELERRDLDDLVLQKDVYLDPQNLVPFSGPVDSYAEGQLFERGSLRDGKRDGQWDLYMDGELAWRRSYRDGEQHGLSIDYDEAGFLLEKVMYQNGEEHGLYEEYVEGELFLIGAYTRGEACGPWTALGQLYVTYDPC